MSILYIVGTPIGNLEDMTFRAVRVLKEVDVVFAEDTREARKLFSHFEIKTQVSSTHTRDEKKAFVEISKCLEDGKNVAIISDAGTPAISDPGSYIVARVREEFPDVKIVPIPGPSALISAVSVAGMSDGMFVFYGFLPHKKGRETLFKEIANNEKASVFYESPHRVLKTFESLKNHLNQERRILVCREITKFFEETVLGTVNEVLESFLKNPEKIRGEFVVVVYPEF